MQQDKISPDLSRILIISLGSLGDIVLSIAAIEAIRNYHKNAHIILITEPYANILFKDCPYIDEVHTNFRPDGMKENISVSTELQKARIELVYDLTCNDESNDFFKRFWLSKPKWSGIAAGCSHPHIDMGREKIHILDRHAEQLWLCGIGPKDGYPIGASPIPNIDWILTPKDEKKYHPKAFGIDYDYAILLPEASSEQKNSSWPSYRYVSLGQSLLKMGLKPIIIGTNDAAALGNEIRAGINDALDLVGRIDILSFVSLVRHAKLVIGTNSDLSIIAGVLGAPLVALINPSQGQLRQVAPRGEKCVSLVSKDFAQIDPNQVLQAARAVL